MLHRNDFSTIFLPVSKTQLNYFWGQMKLTKAFVEKPSVNK
jgi:hypothetical protein